VRVTRDYRAVAQRLNGDVWCGAWLAATANSTASFQHIKARLNTNFSRLAVNRQRLAAAVGSQREDIPARERIADNFSCNGAERGETEVLLQQREQFWSSGFKAVKLDRTLEFKL